MIRRFAAAVCLGLSAFAMTFAPGTSGAADYVEPHITHENYGALKLVFPVTSENSHDWKASLQHAANAIHTVSKWGGTADVKVVLYGPGIMLATHHGDDLGKSIEQLREMGGQVLLCNNALHGFNLDWHELPGVKETDIVPAGVLEVGYLQDRGYRLDF